MMTVSRVPHARPPAPAPKPSPRQPDLRRAPGLGVIGLDDPRARAPAVAGRKAANLARALGAGMPVLPGFVVPAEPSPNWPAMWPAVDRAAERLGTWPLIVRSSSSHEDGETSSQAGRFLSVRDVTGLAELHEAVQAVARSGTGLPVAVLVQPQVDPLVSGVLFAVDPVTGRPGARVSIVAGSPERLVSGEVAGTDLVLSGRGVFRQAGRGVRQLPGAGVRVRTLGRALARLAARAEALFGGPQDIEWAWGRDGRLWLLQSRPVTKTAAPVPRGARLLGAGPIAETLPAPLWPLEVALWAQPLDEALTAALGLVGRRAPGPVVHVVRGRAVADLAAMGLAPRSRLAALDPRPGLRRLRAAWRVGGLRATLPPNAAATIAQIDRLLLEVPHLGGLTDAQLIAVLDRAGQTLTAAHLREALMGLLLSDREHAGPTAAGVALGLLQASTAPVEQRLVDEPALLALTPPAIGLASWPEPTGHARPTQSAAHDRAADDFGRSDPALLREALRLRIRWLQELQARVARELGARLAARGQLPTAIAVRALTPAELSALLSDPAERWAAWPDRSPDQTPLPTAFRLAADGSVVAAPEPGRDATDATLGTGAGGGRAAGIAVHDPARLAQTPPGAAVLVVDVLDPALAVHLPQLAGLVAESGSPLSHLAILAREHGVATVVALAGARGRFAPGTPLLVDGRTGALQLAAGQRRIA